MDYQSWAFSNQRFPCLIIDENDQNEVAKITEYIIGEFLVGGFFFTFRANIACTILYYIKNGLQ